jgi:hypothetical protein
VVFRNAITFVVTESLGLATKRRYKGNDFNCQFVAALSLLSSQRLRYSKWLTALTASVTMHISLIAAV